jgi:hypothetical protein
MNFIASFGYPALNPFTRGSSLIDRLCMKLDLFSLSTSSIRFLLPIPFLFLVWFFESAAELLLGHQTLAPLLSILSLGILAFFCTPRVIACATPIFVAESYCLLSDHSLYPFVRSATVALGGLLAFFVSNYQARLHRERTDIETLLKLLPTPWIQVDCNGNLLRLSHFARTFFDVSDEALTGVPFLSLFSTSGNKGVLIQKFLAVADSPFSTAFEKIHLSLDSSPNTHFHASLSPLPSSQGLTVLVVLTPL